MPRQLKRFNPKGSKYERKTLDKHGREVVKPFKKEDYEEMQRILRVRMESLEETSEEYFRWYRLKILMHLGVNTGLRITTLIELTPRDISDGEVTFTEHKTGKRMQYSMSKEVMQPINDYIKWLGITQSQYLFPRSKENNFPELAYKTVVEEIISNHHDENDIKVGIAKRDGPSGLIDIA